MLVLTHLVTLLTFSISNAFALSRDGKSGDPTAVSIYCWPISKDKPSPIAVVNLHPSADDSTTASLFKYSPPSLGATDDVVRIGILHPKTKQWTGTAVSRDVFATDVDRTIQLHVDEATGAVWSVSLFAEKVPAPGTTKEEKEKTKKDKKAKIKKSKEPPRAGKTTVEVVQVNVAPEPVLNKPVVLNLDGKVTEAETDNRSFLQKYWWAIALFLLVNVLAGGGDDK